MDIKEIVKSALDFSKFVAARLIVFVFFVLIFIPIITIPESWASADISSLPLVLKFLKTYESLIDAFRITEVGSILVIFIFFTAIHIAYEFLRILGAIIPIKYEADELRDSAAKFRSIAIEEIEGANAGEDIRNKISSDLNNIRYSIETELIAKINKNRESFQILLSFSFCTVLISILYYKKYFEFFGLEVVIISYFVFFLGVSILGYQWKRSTQVAFERMRFNLLESIELSIFSDKLDHSVFTKIRSRVIRVKLGGEWHPRFVNWIADKIAVMAAKAKKWGLA